MSVTPLASREGANGGGAAVPYAPLVTTAPLMSNNYKHGQRDGLRLALAILAAEEAKWSALLGESRSWRTNAIREVRHKALHVAQTRIQTALNRLAPKDADVLGGELASALDRVGEGTDVFRLIRAIHDGLIWYDPADSIYANNLARVRPQWRTSTTRLETTMRRLYGASRVVTVR